MKKAGILNAQLSRIVATMGHSDKLVICDSGLPIPRQAEVVDLAVTANLPRFLEVVRVVLQELKVEGAVIAEEMEKSSDGIYRELQGMLPNVELKRVPHTEFKSMTSRNGNIAFVRTGEATPYANVILISGVTFG